MSLCIQANKKRLVQLQGVSGEKFMSKWIHMLSVHVRGAFVRNSILRFARPDYIIVNK